MYICIYAMSEASSVVFVVVGDKGVRQTASRVEVGSQCSAVTAYLL